MSEDPDTTEVEVRRILRNPDAEDLLRIWLDNDQPCRAWCLRLNAGGEPCFSKDGHSIEHGDCWFDRVAANILVHGAVDGAA